ncbi:MAG TPA: DUF1905 domain-containing protein [Burkholderiaceae bacterium]|nr:DUF1905 domain-containing protein [Burkholderiaceae bacterium]
MTSQLHTVEFTEVCWLYSGKGAWYFVTLPTDCAAEITFFSKARNGGKRTGWGSVKVTAQIGKTVWQTSLFPDSKNKSYVLPLKAAVRKAENIVPNSPVKVRVSMPMP